MKPNLIIQTPKLKLKKPNELQAMLCRIVEAAGLKNDDAKNVLIDIVAVEAKQMHEINQRHLNHDYPTDVIAFDLQQESCLQIPDDDEPITAAEIFICPETAQRASTEYATTPEYETILYIIHGMLHIAGLDDKSDEEKMVMREREQQIMQELKLETQAFDFLQIID